MFHVVIFLRKIEFLLLADRRRLKTLLQVSKQSGITGTGKKNAAEKKGTAKKTDRFSITEDECPSFVPILKNDYVEYPSSLWFQVRGRVVSWSWRP